VAKSGTTISLAELRARVVRAQGYASRARTGTAADVLATIRRLACVQLDSISTVDRSHRIALGARVGAYPETAIAKLMRDGKIFEYWAHEACLVPIEDFRMHRWRMQELAETHPWHGSVLDRDPALTQHVLDELAQNGPLPSRHFEGKGSGGMWNWKPAKVVLEALHSAGRVVIAGRENFQRLYALPENVLPPQALDGPPPTRDEFVRWATLRAVEARGALTEKAVAEMFRLKGGVVGIRPHADAWIEAGELHRVDVADGGAPVLVPAREPDGSLPSAVLLSPFDNLLWDRDYLARVFGFRHVIEVYKREHERVYGYYVLPLLRRDRLVGRVDLKHERAEQKLVVKAFHPEPGVRGNLHDCLDAALLKLGRVIGTQSIDFR
jgi:uncharacterized protein YcaQ